MTDPQKDLAACEAEIARLQGDRMAWRLSKPAFIKAWIELAGSSEERIETIRSELARRPEDHPGAIDYVNRLRRMLRVWNFSAPSRRGIASCSNPEADGELARLGCTHMEIASLAVEQLPDDFFGSANVVGEAQAQLAQLERHREELAQRVGVMERLGAVIREIEAIAAGDGDLLRELQRMIDRAIRRGRETRQAEAV